MTEINSETCDMNLIDQPENFINRELSWLKFNRRVLGEADARYQPLLERLKFIAITSSNLDEFFMIRVAGIKQLEESAVSKIDAAGLTLREQLERIAEDTHEQVKVQYRYLRAILRELEECGITLKEVNEFDDKSKESIEKIFHNTIFPVITPMAVDAGHPFPFLANRSLNLAVALTRKEGDSKTAVIQVPAVLPRIIEVPSEEENKRQFIFLEDIIKHYCAHLFYGYKIQDVVPFRITRNADLAIDEEDAEDLLAEVEKSLRQRNRGRAVRLEIGKTTNRRLRDYLMRTLDLIEEEVYDIPGPIAATCFFKFTDLPGFEHFRSSPFIPQMPKDLLEVDDLFDAIGKRDILVHHPYESFEPVVEFVRQAANDPKVLAIKQTLYRVSGNSPIVRALAQAAENGKQVTVLVELKARFDEENNILWARRLEEAGCHVIYGLIGMKTHAKMVLVVRKEHNGIKRYVHMGTGNYNDATAKIYSDLGLFTANDQFGADASAFFNLLSGYSDPPVWNKIVVAPLGLREEIKSRIDQEIQFARQGKGGHIIAKMNSLVDKDIVLKLYEASCKGVKIDLIVRGICVLCSGVPGVSENITVRSIIGTFLEHHRIFYFANGGDEKIFLSSADWMPRNLNDRVELFFPIEDPGHMERIKGILNITLADNQKAYIMKKDGSYRRTDKRGKAVNSQMEFYAQAQVFSQVGNVTLEQRLKPLYRKTE
ncbi:MAG TPA: RNA degradosome polyphosphate kinase [Methylomusa anaerophila]|uniref:Polyphosphate kinase n=1 Tax=Methylomusa anaerophila TaxID=1930071 RepID=A0A348AIC3_9FIRM|nr:RNA degradosome polyphosphate kinase [Methylomusa anaerophila]BBB90821.1 polyphosphate kinase [Methylomusa anaerophila]HML90522.1 RNA degradosome polyphosphate kinase [Methylomusa anaerophila]